MAPGWYVNGTADDEGNEEGGRPTYLVAVGIAAVGHASVTVLGRSGHFLELGLAKRDCVWPCRRGVRGFCGRWPFPRRIPTPAGPLRKKGAGVGIGGRACDGCNLLTRLDSRAHSALAGRLATWWNEFCVPTPDELTWFLRTSFGHLSDSTRSYRGADSLGVWELPRWPCSFWRAVITRTLALGPSGSGPSGCSHPEHSMQSRPIPWSAEQRELADNSSISRSRGRSTATICAGDTKAQEVGAARTPVGSLFRPKNRARNCQIIQDQQLPLATPDILSLRRCAGSPGTPDPLHHAPRASRGARRRSLRGQGGNKSRPNHLQHRTPGPESPRHRTSPNARRPVRSRPQARGRTLKTIRPFLESRLNCSGSA